MANLHMYDTVIVGAGICGLTAAYRLHQAGLSVLLVEQDKAVAGKIKTEKAEGFQVEKGPNSFISKGEAIMSLCRDLGLQPKAASSVMKKRYIYHHGELCPVPDNPLALVTTRLLSLQAKVRLLQEPFQPVTTREDESIADFTRRRLGPEVLNQLMAPFLTGVYAGDPEALSLPAVFPKLAQWERENGSLLKGAFRAMKQAKQSRKPKVPYQIMSFEKGMQELPQALAKALPQGRIKLETTLVKIQHTGNGYQLTLSNGDEIGCKTLLLATPAYTAAPLLSPLSSQAGQILREIPYGPIRVVHLGFQRQSIPHPLDGFGFLVPRNEGIRLLGSIWASTLFSDRAAENQVLLTCMQGGALEPEVMDWDEDTLVENTLNDLATVFKIPRQQLQPRFQKVFNYSQAIPQYTLGHRARVGQLLSALEQVPGLFLTGNYLQGISLNDCVREASQTAETIKTYLCQSKTAVTAETQPASVSI